MGPTSPRVVTKLTTRKTANCFLWLIVFPGARTTSERFSGHPFAQTLPSHHRWRYPTSFPPIQRFISILNPKTTILSLSPTSLDRYQIGFYSCKKKYYAYDSFHNTFTKKILNSRLLLIIINKSKKKNNLRCEFKLKPIFWHLFLKYFIKHFLK